ncbi:MAG: flagellin, partial [Candidatus Riflebacteria bacterium]
GLGFQVGINNDPNDRLVVSIAGVRASTLGTGTSFLNSASISTVTKALMSLDVIDASITDISKIRSKLGATQNRLQVTINNLASYSENLSSANSQIRDVDVAAESAEMARYQILQQAGISVLSQANQMPQVALNLLQG